MNALAWKELYDKFAAFAHEARQHGFYVAEIDKMESSIFDMSPFPKESEIKFKREDDKT